MGFFNPLLLWALPLAAVPIIIHLLNRRRFRTVRWAAMEFLLRAMKRNRRRLRMEHWLILLLRTLAVLFLVLLVARPQLSDTTLGAKRTHHIICLDDSASLAQRGVAGNAFDAAKESLGKLAQRLATQRVGDLFTLLRASDAKNAELSEIVIGPSLATRVAEVLRLWQPSGQILDPGTLLSEAKTRADSSEVAQLSHIYLFTDFRRQDWLSAEGEANPTVEAMLQQLDDQQQMTMFIVGSDGGENLAVTNIICSERIQVAGVPLTFAIEISNRGQNASDSTQIAIVIDGRTRVMMPVKPLEPGASTQVSITQSFHRPGYHGVSAELPADRFPPDDQRSIAFEIREFSQVLIVDGDFGEVVEESESYFLAAALDPGGEQTTGIQVRIIADHELATLSEAELGDADMIWICNLARPSKQIADRLEAFASQGGGVVFFLGNQVDIDGYNLFLFRDGEGILPTALAEVAGDMARPSSVFLSDRDHRLFARLAEFYQFMFSQLVQVGRHITMRLDPESPVRVLLRLGDAEGEPLMVSHSYKNAGKVTVIGTTADIFWTSWPTTPAYQTLCLDLHGEGARPQDLDEDNLLPGDAFTLDVDPGLFRPDIVVMSLSKQPDPRTYSAPDGGEDGKPLVIPMTDLRYYGLYAVNLQDHNGRGQRRLFARNSILEEGLLSQLSEDAFARSYAAEAVSRINFVNVSTSEDGEQLAGSGGLWRWFALALLLGLILESLLAWRFGRR